MDQKEIDERLWDMQVDIAQRLFFELTCLNISDDFDPTTNT